MDDYTDDYKEWLARRRQQRERDRAMYDEPIRDEWSLMLEMCHPFLLAAIAVVLVLAVLYFATP